MGANSQTGETAGQPSSGEEPHVTTANQGRSKRKRGFSRFIALLNCCAVPENANSMDTDGPLVRPKVTTGSRLSAIRSKQRGKQAAVVANKSDANVPESSMTDSKEPIDELARDSEKTEIGSDLQKTTEVAQQNPSQEKVDAEMISEKMPENHNDVSRDDRPSEEPRAHHPDVPPNITVVDHALGDGQESSQTSDVKVTIQAPTPEVSQMEQQPSIPVEQTMAPTSSLDEDVAMVDAPAPVTEDISKEPTEEVIAPTATELPPPPPLVTDHPPNPQPVPPIPEVPTEPAPVPEQQPQQQWLLPPVQAQFKGRKCLVLDLDETLVHSSFKILHQADFTIPVEIEGQYHNVYVIKRPGVDQFMKRVGELYEVVVFTASVSKYGDPLLDQLDIHKVVHHRLFRESCYNHQGNYVKDLSQVGRDLRETIIIDNSPTSYIFHPQHAVPISSWFSDAHDNELLDLIPVLEDLAGPQVKDVSLVLDVSL
ncbi:MAG: hypothetical protein M1816_006636 [Peltula sp. TS41687]|nr:MAG: hypothetical protein M1816_006636 [Peltula sp. TS41687]